MKLRPASHTHPEWLMTRSSIRKFSPTSSGDYPVPEAASAEQALDLLKPESPVSTRISDITMPVR